MRTQFVTFEGYDGAGKTTLIEAVRESMGTSRTRVIGRKNESELQSISGVIENSYPRPHPEVEVLLRMGLEMERQRIVAQALPRHDLVVCDRGVISLGSWFDYLDVSREPFEPLMKQISEYYRNSVMIVCTADFDTCWSRVADRPNPSPKEQLGVDTNRRYFAMYESNIAACVQAGFDVIRIDTAHSSVAESSSAIIEALRSRGLC